MGICIKGCGNYLSIEINKQTKPTDKQTQQEGVLKKETEQTIPLNPSLELSTSEKITIYSNIKKEETESKQASEELLKVDEAEGLERVSISHLTPFLEVITNKDRQSTKAILSDAVDVAAEPQDNIKLYIVLISFTHTNRVRLKEGDKPFFTDEQAKPYLQCGLIKLLDLPLHFEQVITRHIKEGTYDYVINAFGITRTDMLTGDGINVDYHIETQQEFEALAEIGLLSGRALQDYKSGLYKQWYTEQTNENMTERLDLKVCG